MTTLAPSGFQHRSLVEYAAFLAVLAPVVTLLAATAPAFDKLGSGIARLFAPPGMLTRMVPPDFSRIVPIGWKLLETLQMAVAGCFLGLILALAFAILATGRLSPHPIVRHAVRAVIALFRIVQDLVWAIIFTIIVGLGPADGVMVIMVDKISFAGRFLVEAIEGTDPGPQDALRAIGASRLGIIGSAVIPACLPSFTATSLFALEKSVRGSAAPGLVGPGGIGVDLKVALDLLNYDAALAIILMMLGVAIAIEQALGWIRRKLTGTGWSPTRRIFT